MKKFISIILTIAALVMTFGTMSVAAEEAAEPTVDYEIAGNLFKNGDFEEGYENWSGLNGGWAIGGAHSGNYSMTVSWGSGQKCSQNVTLEKGKVYLLSVWVKLHENSTHDGSGATTAFYITSADGKENVKTALSNYQKWNSDLGVKYSKDEWKQVIMAINTNGMVNDSAAFTVGFNGQSGAVVLVDDFYIGEPVISDIVLSNVTCTINSTNAGFIYEWDEDSVDMDFSEMPGSNGYSEPVCYPVFLNQLGTTNEMPAMKNRWSDVSVTLNYTLNGSEGLRVVSKSSSDPKFVVTMAPQFTGAVRPNVPEFTVTVAYGELSKDIKFTSKYSSHKVFLTDENGTVINEDGVLTNGTWTPTYKFYNKDKGWVRYMAISVLYENGVMKDFVITKEIIKDQSTSNSLLETTATDSLTVTDAENSVIKTFAWRQGNGTTAPVWQMEPLFEANVID